MKVNYDLVKGLHDYPKGRERKFGLVQILVKHSDS